MSSKVVVFLWELLQNRLPTKQNLLRRCIVFGFNSARCVFCIGYVESVDRLFVGCFSFSV